MASIRLTEDGDISRVFVGSGLVELEIAKGLSPKHALLKARVELDSMLAHVNASIPNAETRNLSHRTQTEPTDGG